MWKTISQTFQSWHLSDVDPRRGCVCVCVSVREWDWCSAALLWVAAVLLTSTSSTRLRVCPLLQFHLHLIGQQQVHLPHEHQLSDTPHLSSSTLGPRLPEPLAERGPEPCSEWTRGRGIWTRARIHTHTHTQNRVNITVNVFYWRLAARRQSASIQHSNSSLWRLESGNYSSCVEKNAVAQIQKAKKIFFSWQGIFYS